MRVVVQKWRGSGHYYKIYTIHPTEADRKTFIQNRDIFLATLQGHASLQGLPYESDLPLTDDEIQAMSALHGLWFDDNLRSFPQKV